MTGTSRDPLRRRVAGAAAAAVAVHGFIVLAGWGAAWSPFVQPSSRFIPMAPSTALAFVALSLALLTRLVAADRAAGRYFATVVPWVVATTAIVNLIVPAQLDQLLGGASGVFGRVPLGVMSPVTAAALVPLALAVAATEGHQQYAGVLATVSAVIGDGGAGVRVRNAAVVRQRHDSGRVADRPQSNRRIRS